MAGTSLSTGLNRLIKPTKQSKEAMQKYGISIQKTSDGQLDLMGTMEHLREKLGGLDKTTKASVVTQLFGQTAQKGWLAVLNTNKDAWDKLKSAIQNADGVTKEMMKEIEKSGAYAFKILKSNIEELLISVGNALAPAMVDIAKKIGDVALKISDWVQEMQETNPKLLEFVGKMAMIAVVAPPVIMAFGMFTQGLSSITGGIGKSLGKFSNFKKKLAEVGAGTTIASGKLATLGTAIGVSVPVAVGIGVAALAGIATVLGENENALSWLIEKWGWFGETIAMILESTAGVVQITIGNIIILIMTLGEMLVALVTGKFTKLDDIWAKGWAKIENNTAKALSNMNNESTHALKKLKTTSSENLKGISSAFRIAFEKLPNLAKDNVGAVAKEFTTQFKDFNNETIEILRGTSDEMAMLFEGIYEGMDAEAMEKKFIANLESMVLAGVTNGDKLVASFKKTGKLISDSMADGLDNVGRKANEIIDELGNISSQGMSSVCENIASMLKDMDSRTIESLSKLGGDWGKLFDGLSDTSNMKTQDIANKVQENLQKMADESGVPIEQLKEDMTQTFQYMKDNGITSFEQLTSEMVNKTTNAKGELNKVINEISQHSSKSMEEMAKNITASIKKIEPESVASLASTSDSWAKILKGAVDKGGQLSDDLGNVILKNLQNLNLKTPEQWQTFLNHLKIGLEQSKISGGQKGEEIANKISEGVNKTPEKVDPNLGEKVAEKAAPKGMRGATQKEVDGAVQELQNGYIVAMALSN